VCAAISAIYQTALLGLRAIAEAHPEFVRFENMLEEGKPDG
jgi:uncharacterized protein YsxB (DUF464 family)